MKNMAVDVVNRDIFISVEPVTIGILKFWPLIKDKVVIKIKNEGKLYLIINETYSFKWKQYS